LRYNEGGQCLRNHAGSKAKKFFKDQEERTIPSSTPITPKLLDTAVQRIAEAVQPLRIILFGSAARGELAANSHLDLLVVMPDGAHRRNTARRLCRALYGLGVPKDFVVETESDVKQFGDNPSLILSNALKEGRELYRAA